MLAFHFSRKVCRQRPTSSYQPCAKYDHHQDRFGTASHLNLQIKHSEFRLNFGIILICIQVATIIAQTLDISMHKNLLGLKS